jgi:hypothetical protein
VKELGKFNISEITRTGQVAMSKKYKIGVKELGSTAQNSSHPEKVKK